MAYDPVLGTEYGSLPMMESSPAEAIERHRVALRALSEDEFLIAIDQIPPLADTDSTIWDDEHRWEDAYRLVAAADVIGEQGWSKAIVPLFERAAKGDLYGAMQSLRHGPEKAVPHPQELASLIEPLTRHPRAGTRQWSVRELGILRQRSSLDRLLEAFKDDVPEVRSEACTSLEMLGQEYSDVMDLVSALPERS